MSAASACPRRRCGNSAPWHTRAGETCLHGRVLGDQLLDDRWAGSSELATKMIRESGAAAASRSSAAWTLGARIDAAYRVPSVFGFG